MPSRFENLDLYREVCGSVRKLWAGPRQDVPTKGSLQSEVCRVPAHTDEQTAASMSLRCLRKVYRWARGMGPLRRRALNLHWRRARRHPTEGLAQRSSVDTSLNGCILHRDARCDSPVAFGARVPGGSRLLDVFRHINTAISGMYTSHLLGNARRR
jgi:hypothetical protein